MQAINDSFKELDQKYKSIGKLEDIIKKEELSEDDRTIDFLKTVSSEANLIMQNIRDKKDNIENKYLSLVQYLGDTIQNLPMDTFILIFSKFYKDFVVK